MYPFMKTLLWRCLACILGGLSISLTATLRADTFQWTTPVPGNWSTPANWTPPGPPNATGAVALFTSSSASPQVNVNGFFTVGTIQIEAPPNSYNITPDSEIGGGLTFAVSTGTAALNANTMSGTGAHTISAPITLQSPLIVNTGPTSSSSLPTLNLLGTLSSSGTQNITKQGGGALFLSGSGPYKGLVEIQAGLLEVNNSLVLNGGLYPNADFQVDAGATLKGAGTIGSVTAQGPPPIQTQSVTIQQGRRGGTVVVGLSPGILTLQNMTLIPGSGLEMLLDGTVAGTGYDQVDAKGIVTLGGDLDASLGPNYVHMPGTQFDIIKNEGGFPIQGRFGAPQGSMGGLQNLDHLTIGGHLFEITYFGGTSGNDVVLTADPDVVPEPSSLVLGAVGLLSLLGWRRCRRRRES
jgi:autotransporter-associated beta strand protein